MSKAGELSEARRKMREMERRWGKAFLEKSLHQARFDYAALKRIASGFDTGRAALPTPDSANIGERT